MIMFTSLLVEMNMKTTMILTMIVTFGEGRPTETPNANGFLGSDQVKMSFENYEGIDSRILRTELFKFKQWTPCIRVNFQSSTNKHL